MAAFVERSLFDPRSIAGCQLWLDGADSSTIVLSGANVTQWRDKSGRGNHYSNSGLSTINYMNRSIYIPGTGYMQNTSPINYSAGTSPSMTTFVVVSYVNAGATRGIFQYGQVSCSQTGYVIYIDTDNRIYGTLYCGALNVNNAVTSNRSFIISDVVTYSGTPGSLSRAGWVDGSAMSVTNATTTGVNLNLNNSSRLGDAAGQPFLGFISEVLYFNVNLTTTQRQQVEGYLAWKWGLQRQLPSIHPFFTINPYSSIPISLLPTAPVRGQPNLVAGAGFRPTQISGCQLWLDAADPNGNGSLPTNGASISVWRDKSINSFAGTAVNSPTFVSNIVNGNPVIRFNGTNQYINFGNVLNLGTNPLSIFVITKFDTTNESGIIGKTAYSAANMRWALWYGKSGAGSSVTGVQNIYQDDAQTGSSLVLTNPGTIGTQLNMYSYVTNRNAFLLNFNGSLAQSVVNSGTATSFSSSFNLLVGAYADSGGLNPRATMYLNGDIAELIVYFTNLTNEQRQQVEGYLAWKWGLNRQIARTHPSFNPFFSEFFTRLDPIVSTEAVFNPSAVSGCSLWLDADDPSTITRTGTNVTQWREKVSNLAFTTVSTNPTLSNAYRNGRSAISFNGNSYLYNSNFTMGLATRSVFIVAEQTSAAGSTFEGLLTLGASGALTDFLSAAIISYTGRGSNSAQNGQFGLYSSNGDYNMTFGLSQTGAMPIQIYTDIFSSNAGSLIVSGNTIATDTTAVVPSQATGLLVSGRYSGSITSSSGNGLNGLVYEVLLFNSALAAAQRQQVEGYLAWKWGLVGNLPSNHPFKLWPPLPITRVGISASGGTTTTANGFRYHAFLTSGSFTVSVGGRINYLVVGGGGGGGDRHGGGGGAGGVVSGTTTFTSTTYSITVGNGGSFGAAAESRAGVGSPFGAGTKGGDSSIAGIATAFGGGGGGTHDGNPTNVSGSVGSGGGGGGLGFSGVAGTAGQGNSGGNGAQPAGGGGGGAGAAGANANTSTGGIGTAAFSSHLLAVGYGTTFATTPNNPVSGGVAYIAGGGGGAAASGTNPTARAGGLGGGGTGDWDEAVITAGTPNTGGGGGASRSNNVATAGRDGGSGLVLIWYSV
jgi:hypothetical protein